MGIGKGEREKLALMGATGMCHSNVRGNTEKQYEG